MLSGIGLCLHKDQSHLTQCPLRGFTRLLFAPSRQRRGSTERSDCQVSSTIPCEQLNLWGFTRLLFAPPWQWRGSTELSDCQISSTIPCELLYLWGFTRLLFAPPRQRRGSTERSGCQVSSTIPCDRPVRCYWWAATHWVSSTNSATESCSARREKKGCSSPPKPPNTALSELRIILRR